MAHKSKSSHILPDETNSSSSTSKRQRTNNQNDKPPNTISNHNYSNKLPYQHQHQQQQPVKVTLHSQRIYSSGSSQSTKQQHPLSLSQSSISQKQSLTQLLEKQSTGFLQPRTKSGNDHVSFGIKSNLKPLLPHKVTNNDSTTSPSNQHDRNHYKSTDDINSLNKVSNQQSPYQRHHSTSRSSNVIKDTPSSPILILHDADLHIHDSKHQLQSNEMKKDQNSILSNVETIFISPKTIRPQPSNQQSTSHHSTSINQSKSKTSHNQSTLQSSNVGSILHKPIHSAVNSTDRIKSTGSLESTQKSISSPNSYCRPPSLLKLAELYAKDYDVDPFSFDYCAKILNNQISPPIMKQQLSNQDDIHTHDLTDLQSNQLVPSHIINPTVYLKDGIHYITSNSPMFPLLSNSNQLQNPNQLVLTENYHPTQSNFQFNSQRYSNPLKFILSPSFSITQPQFARIPLSHYLLTTYNQSISFNSQQILFLFQHFNIEQRLLPPFPCILSCLLRICDYFRVRFDVFMNAVECLLFYIKAKVLKQWLKLAEEEKKQIQLQQDEECSKNETISTHHNNISQQFPNYPTTYTSESIHQPQRHQYQQQPRSKDTSSFIKFENNSNYNHHSTNESKYIPQPQPTYAQELLTAQSFPNSNSHYTNTTNNKHDQFSPHPSHNPFQSSQPSSFQYQPSQLKQSFSINPTNHSSQFKFDDQYYQSHHFNNNHSNFQPYPPPPPLPNYNPQSYSSRFSSTNNDSHDNYYNNPIQQQQQQSPNPITYRQPSPYYQSTFKSPNYYQQTTPQPPPINSENTSEFSIDPNINPITPPIDDSQYIIITQLDIIAAIIVSSKFYDNRFEQFSRTKFLSTFSSFLKSAPSHPAVPTFTTPTPFIANIIHPTIHQQPSSTTTTNQPHHFYSHPSLSSSSSSMLANHQPINNPLSPLYQSSQKPSYSTQSIYSKFFLDLLPGIDLYSNPPLYPSNVDSTIPNKTNPNSISQHSATTSVLQTNYSSASILSPKGTISQNRLSKFSPHRTKTATNSISTDSSIHPPTNNECSIQPYELSTKPDPGLITFLHRYGLLYHEYLLLHHFSSQYNLKQPTTDKENKHTPRLELHPTHHHHHRQESMVKGASTSLGNYSHQSIPFNSLQLHYSELALFSNTFYNVSFLNTSNCLALLDFLILIVVNYLDLHGLLDSIFETIFGSNSNIHQQSNHYQHQQNHQQHQSQIKLPTRLVYFLQKQLSICPYTFGHSVSTPSPHEFANQDPHFLKHGYDKKTNSTSTNLPPLSKQKQVTTIIRFLCEILIKVTLFFKSISFQFQWPNDILCGVIVSSILHLFPLYSPSHATTKQQHQYQANKNGNEYLFESQFHTEIDKRIQQQLLYFSNPTTTTPPEPATSPYSQQPIHHLPSHLTSHSSSYQPFLNQQFNTHSQTSNNTTSSNNTLRIQLATNWDGCYQIMFFETLTPWLQQSNESTTNPSFSQPQKSSLPQSFDCNIPISDQVENNITQDLRQAPLSIRSNITPCSSMSFYDIDASFLYKQKLQQIINYQSFMKSNQATQLNTESTSSTHFNDYNHTSNQQLTNNLSNQQLMITTQRPPNQHAHSNNTNNTNHMNTTTTTTNRISFRDSFDSTSTQFNPLTFIPQFKFGSNFQNDTLYDNFVFDNSFASPFIPP